MRRHASRWSRPIRIPSGPKSRRLSRLKLNRLNSLVGSGQAKCDGSTAACVRQTPLFAGPCGPASRNSLDGRPGSRGLLPASPDRAWIAERSHFGGPTNRVIRLRAAPGCACGNRTKHRSVDDGSRVVRVAIYARAASDERSRHRRYKVLISASRLKKPSDRSKTASGCCAWPTAPS